MSFYTEESDKDEIVLSREAVCNGSGNPLLLIITGALTHGILTPAFEEHLQGREKDMGGKWISGNIYPLYGTIWRSNIRKVPINVCLGDEGTVEDLGDLVNMFGRNHMRIQYPQCVYGKRRAAREEKR